MPDQNSADRRVFLFLQGPHGPFFHQLGRVLTAAGSRVWRVGFNAGDAAFWPTRSNFIADRADAADWPARFKALVAEKSVTDIVLYGDTRPVHATAVTQAKDLGLRVHIFEEGYVRPYWITYERDGANGHSKLMDMSLDHVNEIDALPAPVPPCHWGDMRQHMFYGALYHWFVMFWNKGYPHFRPHRALHVRQEFSLHIKRLILMPLRSLERRWSTLKIKRGGFPYHLALLQLEHDSSFQMHSPFDRQSEFLDLVIDGFAKGAPPHHHLVFKAHPLEDGRAPLRRDIKAISKRHGIPERVHFISGGKLAGLLSDARSAVTVNSTAGQQALWRGIPLRIFGQAIYGKAAMVSHQSLPEFFANPHPGERDQYRRFRDFLLRTSQLPGSFYATKGRRQALRIVIDKMLNTQDPYAKPTHQTATQEQQFRIVR